MSIQFENQEYLIKHYSVESVVIRHSSSFFKNCSYSNVKFRVN